MSRKIAVILSIVFMAAAAAAQEPPAHEKKVYVSPEGKIYWNKALPVYVRLSPSPDDDAPSYLMHSESTAEYADPYFFDTEGVNFIRTKWAVDPKTGETVYPQFEVVWEVYRDGLPPVSDIRFKNSKILSKGDKIFAGKSLSVSFTAKDAMSGVENVYFSLDGGAYRPFADAVELTEEKEYVLKYYAVDHVGNVEEVKSKTITIDFSAPKTTYSFIGDTEGEVISGRTTLELSSTDEAAGVASVFYRIDSAEERTYSGPISFAGLPEGAHTVSFYAKDELANRETPQTLSVFIDNTPPIVASDLLGDRFISAGREFSSGRTRVKLTAVDNKAGIRNIYYSINGEEHRLYDKPFFLSGNSGDQKISFYAVDNVGNKSSSSIGAGTFSTPYLDLTGPELSYTIDGPRFFLRDSLYINDKTAIILRGEDAESGLQKITYSINKGDEYVYEDPIRITEEGAHEITFFGFDNVNNSNKSALAVVVDKEGPDIFPRLSVSPVKKVVNGAVRDVYATHAVLFLSATDAQVGYETMYYSVNGGKENAYSSAIEGFKQGEEYKIFVKALDKLGNMNTDEIEFTIDD